MKKVTSLRGKIRGRRILMKQSPVKDYLGLSVFRIWKYIICICVVYFLASCQNKNDKKRLITTDTSLVNTKHLDHLSTPITFSNNVKTTGIYIYAEAPDYHLVGDSDEGFICVDDVARAALVYLRSKIFYTDTAIQNKSFALIQFILEMQSDNGYFYNFLFPGDSINKTGKTSINRADWWSWRALQTLTEGSSLIRKINVPFADKIDSSIDKLIIKIKSEVATFPLTTKKVKGITVPQWLPAGSATDQASILILGLISYCTTHYDRELKNYIRNLAEGIAMMQQGDETNFPYSCFLSWENVWHAYGNDQAFALMKAGSFLKESKYHDKALAEVDNFYPWLLKNGMKSSFSIIKKGNEFIPADEKEFAQIAYGIRPMIFAATEAYELTGKQMYADNAARLIEWFFGANVANEIMYDTKTGRCFDGIIDTNKVNKNSGAESTIEALLALQKVEEYPAIIQQLNKYKKK